MSYSAQFCGKVTHESRDQAEGHILLLRFARKAYERDRGPLHAYYCDDCAGWHVGHDRRAPDAQAA